MIRYLSRQADNIVISVLPLSSSWKNISVAKYYCKKSVGGELCCNHREYIFLSVLTTKNRWRRQLAFFAVLRAGKNGARRPPLTYNVYYFSVHSLVCEFLSERMYTARTKNRTLFGVRISGAASQESISKRFG